MTKTRRSNAEAGFTLIELMVVIVIIGLLSTFVVLNVLPAQDTAMVEKARADVALLEQAVEMYRLDNLAYPTTEQGLAALAVRPTAEPVPQNWKQYLKQAPADPWGRPYQYLNPGVRGEIDLFSLGADGQPAGDGVNADIGNWSLNR